MSFIKEQFRAVLLEVETSAHFFDRIEQRIHGLKNDLSSGEMKGTMNSINLLRNYDFPSGNFAVRVGKFRPNPDSELYVSVGRDGRGYYQIMDDAVLTDSTGDEIWAVVRDNKVTTVMLRKTIQTKDVAHNNDRMDVDHSIYNLEKFINSKKEAKEKSKPKDKGLVLNLGGVKWKVDLENETIFKKNKPQEVYGLFDFLDKLDEPSQEKILNYL